MISRFFLKTWVVVLAFVISLTTARADDSVEKRLRRVERQVTQIGDLLLEVERLKGVNRKLLGRVEELEFRLDRLEKKQREMYLDLDQRISSGAQPAPTQEVTRGSEKKPPLPDLKNPLPDTASAQAQVGATTTPAPTPTHPPTAAEHKAYDAAFALLQQPHRDYHKAISAFQSFLKRYPQSDLADNALYWLGETHYVLQENDAALARFNELLQRFPQSDKVPGALLKKGYLLQMAGKKQEARAVFQKLVKEHPDSSVARLARARLKRLK